MADEMVTIKFEQPMAPYHAGEIAGFPEEKAARLIGTKLDGKPLARRATEADVRDYHARLSRHAAKPQQPIAVKFLVPMPPYRIGEIAGFPPELAQDYVDRGWAELAYGTTASKSIDAPAADKAVLSPQAKKALGR